MHTNRFDHNKEQVRAGAKEDASADHAKLEAMIERYNAYLFAEDEDIPEAKAAAMAQEAMQRAKQPRKAKPLEILTFPRFRLIYQIAAGLALLVGAYMLVEPRRSPEEIWYAAQEQRSEPHPTSITRILGASSLGIIGTITFYRDAQASAHAIPLYGADALPVAYLFSDKTNLIVERQGCMPQEVGISCVVLEVGDLIISPPQSQSIVLFESNVVRIVAGGKYHIGTDGRVYPENAENPLPATASPGFRLVVPPAELLRLISPKDVVAGTKAPKSPVEILSPRGNMYTQAPPLVWNGGQDDVFEVTLEGLSDISPELLVPFERAVRLKGGRVTWDEAGLPPLPRDTDWALVFKRADEEVSRVAFRIISEAEAKDVDRQRAFADAEIPPGVPRLFVTSTILLEHELRFGAEAREYVRKIWEEPAARGNLVYLLMAQRSFQSLGSMSGVLDTQAMIKHLIESHVQ